MGVDTMDEIVNQLIKMNRRDVFDILGIIFPIVLTFIIIIQNCIYYRGNKKLQKQIHNRDQKIQHHNDIMMLYNTYYDFCDAIFTSSFYMNVKCANVNSVMMYINNVNLTRIQIGRRRDLARILFEHTDVNLYEIIVERFDLAIKIIDKYLEYYNSGKLAKVSENAWNTICPPNTASFIYKYNYSYLLQNRNLNENYMKLCEQEEIREIDKMLNDYKDLHTYESFDMYFEKYLNLSEL